jgi:hypothetical protein
MVLQCTTELSNSPQLLRKVYQGSAVIHGMVRKATSETLTETPDSEASTGNWVQSEAATREILTYASGIRPVITLVCCGGRLVGYLQR